MLYIAYCIAFHNFAVYVVLSQYEETYTKCAQVGITSVNKTPFLNSASKSAILCSKLCTEVDECYVFSYDDLSKMCGLYQVMETVNCDLNKKYGGIIFTKETDCPANWTRLENSCYFFEDTKKMSWNYATEYCVSQGGYLAEVTDEAELQLVDSIINDDVYIGCLVYNGKWQWTNSNRELLLNDTLWSPGETKESECVQIWKGNKLDDVLCIVPRNFLCEKFQNAALSEIKRNNFKKDMLPY